MQESPSTGEAETGKISGNVSYAEATTTARDLINKLANDLQFHDESASSALREAQDVLSRLASAAPASAPIPASDPVSMIVLDVSDLLGYFEHNRLPTGIQRVQTELIFSLLESIGDRVELCCFMEARNQWVRVDSSQFVDICNQSRAGGDPLDPNWMASIKSLRASTSAGLEMDFPRGAVLLNVGTSWWLPNYFLYVRQAKIAFGLRYVPLIYDLIPAITPENCDPKLVQEFIGWLAGVLDHADFYFTISEATRRDLIAFAEKMGRPIAPDQVAVAPLNADFRPALTQPLLARRRFAEPFVLFVSTLEARKNQLGALDAWSALVARHGPEKVPRLVLVGKRGFQSDLILDRLKNSAELQERVTVLSGIEDAELQGLYRDCLFTIYPSFYEGWGLPVTESLCYGKVPLIADNSSLPEAGGASAIYFKTGSTLAMIAALERLIFDKGYRQKREEIIHRGFRPSSWAMIASGVADRIASWSTTPVTEWQAPLAQPGAYYPLVRNQSKRVWSGMGSAEQFRSGLGWHKLEDEGCWTFPSGAELEMRLASADNCRLGLQLVGSERCELRYRIEVTESDCFVEGRITGGTKWEFFDLPDTLDQAPLRIRVMATAIDEQEITHRRGLGIRGFFIFERDKTSRIDFLEAVALGALSDLDFYRDRSLDRGG